MIFINDLNEVRPFLVEIEAEIIFFCKLDTGSSFGGN